MFLVTSFINPFAPSEAFASQVVQSFDNVRCSSQILDENTLFIYICCCSSFIVPVNFCVLFSFCCNKEH